MARPPCTLDGGEVNLKKLAFKNGNPSVVTVEMTIKEAAFLAKTLGKQNGLMKQEIYPGYEDEEHTAYDCLVGDVFNRYWDSGVDGYVRGDDE